jgi:flagellar protein FlaG
MGINEVASPSFHSVSGTLRPRETSVPSQGAPASPDTDDLSARTTDRLGEALDAAVGEIQEFVNTATRDIEFSVDEDSGRTVVKVVDRETQDVIRQIPSQEVLDLAQALGKLQGLLIRQKV